MKTTFFEEGANKLSLLLRAAGLKGRQVVDALRVATEETISVLSTELKKGNYQEVASLLAAKALLLGKSALLDRITTRVASRLMLRLGLPGIIAAGVVAVLVPFVLMKLRKRARDKNSARHLLESLEIEGDQELQEKEQHFLEEENTGSRAQAPGPQEASAEEVRGEPVK
jgi:hypothetical protein